MKTSYLSFILALLIYSLLILAGYWLWFQTPEPPKNQDRLQALPVNLSMFQLPAETPITPPVEIVPPAPPQQKTEEVIEEIVQPPIEEPIKAPEPVKPPKPIKKIEKPVVKEPIKKVVPKKELPNKVTKPVPKTQPKPQPLPKPETKQTEKVLENIAEQPVKTLDTPATPKAAAKPQFSPQQVANAEQAYLLALREKIAIYAQDTYPKRAKRRRWQGEVLIQFTLNRAGLVSGLSIINSSGKRILDEAALEIFQVKMNNRFKPVPQEIPRDTWNIKVPVSYRLR